MSSAATVSSSPGSHVTPSERVAADKPIHFASVLAAAQDLPDVVHNARLQLNRTHAGMQQLMTRCQHVGTAMERCTEALASLPTTPNTSFTNNNNSSGGGAAAAATAAATDKSSSSASGASAAAAAAATASYRQLYWSLSQFHTHAAQLLSAESVQAYDAAVTDKIANRLSLMERGAATFAQSVARSQQQQQQHEVAVVQGAARQLEQLACTRFTPAYDGFLLYTVATLGDFCALWATAAQKSTEEVVWSSGQEGRSPMAGPLHSEHFTPVTPKTRSGTTADKKSGKSPLLTPKRRLSSTTLSATFAAAIEAVEELRDGLFHYVRMLHEMVHHFQLIAVTLARALAAVYPPAIEPALSDCLDDIDHLDSALANAHTRLTTRRSCYEAIVADGILRPLRQLQEDSKKGVSLDLLFDAVNYPLMEKTSTALERVLRRMKEPRNKAEVSYRPSRTSSGVHAPSGPLEVMFDVWNKTSELCLQIGTEVSDEYTKRVNV